MIPSHRTTTALALLPALVFSATAMAQDLSEFPGSVTLDLVDPELSAWTALGDAIYSVEGDTILGRVGGGAQSFLVTREEFGDFVLQVDVKTEEPGNSGIQVRSHVNAERRLYGYQIEIDPSERGWSGRLYDEGRRGWIDDLADNPAGRAAYQHGAWNRFRIECIGPSIKAWVNDVPTADVLDAADFTGSVALQVHAGNNTRVRWRGLDLRTRGHHAWQSLLAHADWSGRPGVDGQPWEVGAEELRTKAARGASLASRAAVADGLFRLQWLGQGPLSIAQGTAPETSTDPLTQGEQGWRFDLEPMGGGEGEGEDEHELLVYLYGKRLAIDLDGRRVFERHATAPRPLAPLRFTFGDDGPVTVRALEAARPSAG